jgi:adenylate kinase
MRLILLGPPGVGKGTQAKLLCQRLKLQHISTGDLLRHAIALSTPMGRLAKPYVESGQLVPSDLVNDMVNDHFRSEPRPEHFVLDGYPRTVAQAHSFDQVLRQQFLTLDAVVELVVPDEELVRRISGRWTCTNPTCQTSFHTTYKPPRVPGVCDVCGSRLAQREDDREVTVRGRLGVFHTNIADLLKYYDDQGLLRQVHAEGEIEAIYANLVKVLSDAKAAP